MDVDALNTGLLVLRVTVGAVILAHGVNHIVGGGRIAGTARWFESLGMRPGILHAWLASLTEVAVGPMLILGLLTPLAAAGVLGVMLVAWITNHRGNGFFIFRPGEGWEYVMTLSACAVALGAMGAGEWSLDHALDVTFEGFAGLVTTLAVGGGGALVLLALCWRPPAPAPTEAS